MHGPPASTADRPGDGAATPLRFDRGRRAHPLRRAPESATVSPLSPHLACAATAALSARLEIYMFLEFFFATTLLSIPLLLVADWRDEAWRPGGAGEAIAPLELTAQPMAADIPADLAPEPATARLDVPVASLKSAA
jgi:hypothetical protein